MTDTLTPDDVEAQVATRGEDGDLLPQEKTVNWPGAGEKTVKVKPITTGMINKLSRHEDGLEALEPDAVKAVIDTLYLEPDPNTITVSMIQDMSPAALEALIQPFVEELDNFEPEGN